MRASFGSARTLLHELHWLPVTSRIEFKIATLTYKILDSGLPSYLSSQLSHYHSARELRLSSSNLLAQPYPNTNFGSLAYSIIQSSAPKIRNNLPLEITHSRLLRAGLKLTTSAKHLPRSRASPRLRVVPHCSSELDNNNNNNNNNNNEYD